MVPLTEHLIKKLPEPLNPQRITRKLIKKVFMPMVYGKTAMSASQDIQSAMGDILKGRSEPLQIAMLFYEFFSQDYGDIQTLMNLINLGGWFAATLGFPVVFHSKFYKTIQDYMKTEPVGVWVFDRTKMKRKRVTLTVPTTKRDRNKTKNSLLC